MPITTCPSCGFESPAEMKFCGMCGARLKQICPECHFANPLNYHFCGRCGVRLAPTAEPDTPLTKAAPAQPQAALDGQLRTVTVLLADVVGSTNLLEQLGTEAWVELMNQALQILEAEVYRYGGHVDQFRGDGLVAFFGATVAHEDDPERGILSALAMQRAIHEFSSKKEEEAGIQLSLRVGVNTGEVVVASIGDSSRHSEDTAMGAAVALASRMEGAAEPGTVLVSHNTYRLVPTQFEWQPLGEIVVKGVSRPVPIYRPLTAREEATPAHRLRARGLSAPIIGREDELATLRGCLNDVCAGRGGIVLISGEGGMGKSRLVNDVRQSFSCVDNEVRKQFSEDESSSPGDHIWLRARCRSYDQSQPYSVWIGLLWKWLGVREGESEDDARARLRLKAKELWTERPEDHYPYLATLLSLPLENEFQDSVRHLDAEALYGQLHVTMKSWVLALSSRGPLVVSFTGVHWMDNSSLDLLDHCLPVCDEAPVIWLLSYRPKRTDVLWQFFQRVERDYLHRVTRITFAPLTEAESREMIDHLIGPGVLPEATLSVVLAKAEGNPYFIEELIHTLIEEEALVQDIRSGEWYATRAVGTIDLPDTLQSLLLARIDALLPEERQVLQMASVIGTVFWSSVLEALAEDPQSLKRHVTALQRAQLFEERGRVPYLGMEYAFKSALIRDAAYDSILSSRQAKYHEQVAECLEEQIGHEAPGHYFSMLAYHFQRAGRRGKELFYTLLAAEQAREIYANVAALEHYTQAFSLLDEMEAETSDPNRLYAIRSQKFEVLNGRREVYLSLADFDSATADAKALLPLARQLEDDPAWLIDALLQQPGVGFWSGSQDRLDSLQVAEEALARAETIGDRRRQMQSLMAIAIHHLEQGDSRAMEFGEKALALARELGDKRSEAQLLIGIGGVFNWSDDPEKATPYLEAALRICRSLDDKLAEINMLHQLGLQYERQGDYNRLLVDFEQRRLQLAREINHRPVEAEALVMCGQIEGIYLGDIEAGLALNEQARLVWERKMWIVVTSLREIHMRTLQGEYTAALEELERAGPHWIDMSDMVTAGSHLAKAILFNSLGETGYYQRSLLEVEAVKKLVTRQELLSRQYEMAAAVQAAVAHLGLAAGNKNRAEAKRHLLLALDSSQSALEVYRELGFCQIVECVSEEVFFIHSRALAANGRREEAAATLKLARDEMERKLGLLPQDSPFRQTYLENLPLHRAILEASGEQVAT